MFASWAAAGPGQPSSSPVPHSVQVTRARSVAQEDKALQLPGCSFAFLVWS